MGVSYMPEWKYFIKVWNSSALCSRLTDPKGKDRQRNRWRDGAILQYVLYNEKKRPERDANTACWL